MARSATQRAEALTATETPPAAAPGPALTPVDAFDGWWCKREDMAAIDPADPDFPGGAKVRQFLQMVANNPGAPIIVGCSAESAMQVYVAAAAKRAGVPGIIYTPARRERSAATAYAVAMGAEVNEVRPGHLSVCKARARERSKALGNVVRWDPKLATADAAAQVANLPAGCKRVVVPFGTGAITAGILVGLAKAGRADVTVLAVLVSDMGDLDKIKGGAAKAAGDLPLPTLETVQAGMPYDQPVFANLPNGARLDPFYAAKALRFVQTGDCLWSSGIRPLSASPGAPRPPAAGPRPLAEGEKIDLLGMRVEKWPLGVLTPYARNSRVHSDSQVDALCAAFRTYGFTIPILVDDDGMIIAGHGRVMAAERLGMTEVPVIVAAGWSEEQKRAYVIWDNRSAEMATWDLPTLKLEMGELGALGLDLAGMTGFSLDDLKALEPPKPNTGTPGSLGARFGVPPFSVLNAREGWWQDRKRDWLSLGIQSELGRGETGGTTPGAVGGGGLSDQVAGRKTTLGAIPPNQADIMGSRKAKPDATSFQSQASLNALQGETNTTGTSIFDPVLTELAYRWFSAPGAVILDPFAGGSVRGIVAGVLGRQYVGIDLRTEQVAANNAQADAIATALRPIWVTGDSTKALEQIELPEGADLVFSCPPYADLEVYSDDPRDLSTMAYDDFRYGYEQIIAKACARLKANRFACFVVGDVRGPDGAYRNFVSHTIEAFEAAGLRLYNEAILVTAVGSLPVRAGKQFEASRKLGKSHQNVLVFIKGDWREATAAIGQVEFGDVPDPGQSLE